MKSSTIRENLHKLEPGQVEMLFSTAEGIQMLGLKETTNDGNYTKTYDHGKIPNTALEELVQSPGFSKSLLASVFQPPNDTTDPNEKLQQMIQSAGLNTPEGMEKIKSLMQDPEKLKTMAQEAGISSEELSNLQVTEPISDVTEEPISDVTEVSE